MRYISHYESPLGSILLAADEEGLTGLWFEGQKYYASGLDEDCEERETDILLAAKRWLDTYFSGDRPDHMVPLHFVGTDFQKNVWQELLKIPYGATITYADLAARLGRPKAVRAVANANGANALSIFAPCHRVVGSNGSFGGYAGGIEAKRFLLGLEGCNCL